MAGDVITIQVEGLARRLTQQQDDAEATEQHRIKVNTHRVSRVPDHVRQHNPDAYTPGLVAIGPLHATPARRLRAGNRLKYAYIQSLISRGHPDPARHLGVIMGYVRLVAPREWEARAMYAAEDVDDISAEDFIQMLVLDGCFIIEHLVNVATGKEEALLHATPFGPVQLSVDLVLAENQIPFFVLVDLFTATRLPEFDTVGYEPTDLLTKLVLFCLAGEKGRDMSEGLPPADAIGHILHLLHAMVTAAPPPPPPPRTVLEMARDAARLLPRLPLLLLVPLLYPTLPEGHRWSARYVRAGDHLLPSASDLKRMWVRFRTANSTAKAKTTAGIASSVLGPVPLAMKLVRERENRLCLPQLRIEFRTAPLLLNLMAFEQSSADQHAGARDVLQSFPLVSVPDHQDVSQSRPVVVRGVGQDVSAYVWFMTRLVQSPEDAGVLLAAEVVRIISTSGSKSKEQVARFFWQLGAVSEAAELDKSYLGPMLKQLSSYSDPPWTKRADVQRYYIDEPWRLVIAFVALVTTVGEIIQTVMSILQTVDNNKK